MKLSSRWLVPREARPLQGFDRVMHEPVLRQQILLFAVEQPHERFRHDLGRVPSAREHDLTLRAIERHRRDEQETLPGGAADLEIDLCDRGERRMEHVDNTVDLEVHVSRHDLARCEIQDDEAHAARTKLGESLGRREWR